ncbi:MAG: hypothetical protein ACYCX8_05765 [Acidimicrobiales bacterium]
MDRVIRTGFRRGLRGGDPLWLVLGASAWMVRRARRSRHEVVYRTRAEPGDRLEISLRSPSTAGTRRERRRVRA